jgi:hypothetical protein
MLRINARQDPWVKNAVGFLKRCPGLTIPEAMKLANFTPQETCKSKQMWIYRLWNKLTEERNVTFATPPPQQVSFAANNNNDSQMLSSMSASTSKQSPKKKIKSTCTTASAKQTHQTAMNVKNK